MNSSANPCALKLTDLRKQFGKTEIIRGANLDIPDPWYAPEAGYHQVYDLIDKACEALIENYSRTK